MPVDAIEQLFASQAAERKAAVLQFTPDEIRITAENKFDDGIYELLYGVWKETSGEYDPKDDKPIVDPRGNTTTKNETKFKYWAMEQYGMTAEEYRGHTLDGTLKTLGEIDMAKDKVMIALALPSMIKNAVKTVKEVAHGVPFDISIGAKAGSGSTEEGTKEIAEKVTKIKNIENTSKNLVEDVGNKEIKSLKSNTTKDTFLPDEYYENLNKRIQYGYQEPNTKQIYKRLGNTSHEVETSIVISDDFGRIKYRVDYSTHGNNAAHTNPHIHEFTGNTTKGDYQIIENRYFIDENTGKMRLGKSNNDGTYNWLDE